MDVSIRTWAQPTLFFIYPSQKPPIPLHYLDTHHIYLCYIATNRSYDCLYSEIPTGLFFCFELPFQDPPDCLHRLPPLLPRHTRHSNPRHTRLQAGAAAAASGGSVAGQAAVSGHPSRQTAFCSADLNISKNLVVYLVKFKDTARAPN